MAWAVLECGSPGARITRPPALRFVPKIIGRQRVRPDWLVDQRPAIAESCRCRSGVVVCASEVGNRPLMQQQLGRLHPSFAMEPLLDVYKRQAQPPFPVPATATGNRRPLLASRWIRRMREESVTIAGETARDAPGRPPRTSPTNGIDIRASVHSGILCSGLCCPPRYTPPNRERGSGPGEKQCLPH